MSTDINFAERLTQWVAILAINGVQDQNQEHAGVCMQRHWSSQLGWMVFADLPNAALKSPLSAPT
jgi:hypothetical protein